MQAILTNAGLGRARRQTRDGREYLVAPASLIVPGVLNGSDGALYYPPVEIARNYRDWDRMPLTHGHPVDPLSGAPASAHDPGVIDNQGLGWIEKPFANGKLAAEAWFDVERTRALDQKFGSDILNRLERGQAIEQSTGLYVDKESAPVGASYRGRPYEKIARNYRPDHVAVLPNQVGACSVADGCGILVNRQVSNTSEGAKKAWETRGGGGVKEAAQAARKASVKAIAATRKVGVEKYPLPAGPQHAERILRSADERSSAAASKTDRDAHLEAAVAHSAMRQWHESQGHTEAAAAHQEAANAHGVAVRRITPRQTSNEYVTNPFVSEAQRRACYAANDPDWDCEEWERHTKSSKLPKKATANMSLVQKFWSWLHGVANEDGRAPPTTNPFASEAQRRYLWANEPDIAESWAHGEHTGTGKRHAMPEEEGEFVGKTTKGGKGLRASGKGGGKQAKATLKKALAANAELYDAVDVAALGPGQRAERVEVNGKAKWAVYNVGEPKAPRYEHAGRGVLNPAKQVHRRHPEHEASSEARHFSDNVTNGDGDQETQAPEQGYPQEAMQQRTYIRHPSREPPQPRHPASGQFQGQPANAAERGHADRGYDDEDEECPTGNAADPAAHVDPTAPAKLEGYQKRKDGRNLDVLEHEEQDDDDPEDVDAILDTQADDHQNPKHGPDELAEYGRKLGITANDWSDAARAAAQEARKRGFTKTVEGGNHQKFEHPSGDRLTVWSNGQWDHTRGGGAAYARKSDRGAKAMSAHLDARGISRNEAVDTENQDGAAPMLAYNAPDDAHGMSKHAAGRSLMAEHAGGRGHALSALDHSGEGDAKKAAAAHGKAAEAHEAAALESRKRGDGAGAEVHDDAAAMHRKAASMHLATTNEENPMSQALLAKLRGLVGNCSCPGTRNALQAILNTSDESGSGSASDQAGGEEESEEGEDSEYRSKEAPALKDGAKVGGGSLGGKKKGVLSENAAVEAWMRQTRAPAEVRAAVQNMRKAEYDRKLTLVRYLVANVGEPEQRRATGDMLMGKSIAELEQLTAIVPRTASPQVTHREPAALFLGAAGGPVGNALAEDADDDVLDLPTINYAELSKEQRQKAAAS